MWTASVPDWQTKEQQDAVARTALAAAVNVERDRRIALGFMFDGKLFQCRLPNDLININGASNAASIATLQGAQEGDLRWSDPATDFAWIATDNTSVPMDAPTTIRFGQTAVRHVDSHVKAARELKNKATIPVDYVENKWWPVET